MNNNETFTVALTERDEPCFTIVVTVIDPRQAGAVKDKGCCEKIDTVFVKVRLALGFVPLEVQCSVSDI